MPRQNQVKEYRTFVKGIITEASPLTFPENASIDEENFVLNRDGSRQRRLGMDYENLSSKISTTLNTDSMGTAAITTYRWDNINNNPTVSLSVVQVGYNLFFLDALADPVSSNIKNGGAALIVSASGTSQYQFASINGVLVVVTGETAPFYVEYDDATDTITTTNITIEVRDLWGVDDGISNAFRPPTLTSEHKYNLLNQGWRAADIQLSGGHYVASVDIQHIGKDATGTYTEAALNKQFFGTTPAPKGKYILDAFNRGTDRTSSAGVTVTPDKEQGFIKTACAHAGRVFYSGVLSNVTSGDVRSPTYTGFIFYTKTLDSLNSLGRCYQEADPTSEHIFDLIDTDGGYVTIPEASNIYKVVSYTNSVIVFADNGIWRLFSTEKGFTAADQELERITNVGAVNAESIVVAENTIYYWAKGGIYAIQAEEISGGLVANNIAQHTIQTLYIDIGSVGRASATGNYDTASKQVSWLYNTDSTYDGITFKNKYNRELVFDTILGAFYKSKIESLSTNSPYVAAYMPIKDVLNLDSVQNVIVSGERVQVDGEDVVVTVSAPAGTSPASTKYLTIVPSTTYTFTFSYYKDADFVDWQSEDTVGITYSSYLNTGYEIQGDTMRTKQVPYVFFHFDRTEDGYEVSGNGITYTNPSSCIVQSQWGWSDSANSGRWGAPFQAYRLNRHYIPSGVDDSFDYGFSVVTTKNKLRGKGEALSLYIYSEEGKDMRLLGWAISAAGVSVP